jgi:xanthine/uracil permease
MILANGLAAGTITAVIVNAFFQHLPLEQFQEKCAAVFRPE